MKNFIPYVDSLFGKHCYQALNDEWKKDRVAQEIIEAIVLDDLLNEKAKERILFLANRTNQYLYNTMQPTSEEGDSNLCSGCSLLQSCPNKDPFQDLEPLEDSGEDLPF